MAQQQTPRFRQPDSTELFTDLAVKPGVIQGFVPTVVGPNTLSLGPGVSRLEHTSDIGDNDVAVKRIQSVIATKQGIYVTQDTPYQITGYPAGVAGQFRVDALIYNHKYISGETPQVGVVTVLQGTLQPTRAAALASAPNTSNLPNATLIGYVTMDGASLNAANIEILYVDPVAYYEYSKLDAFVGSRETPPTFASFASNVGKDGATVTGALYGAEARLDNTVATLLATLDLVMPRGVIMYTQDSPSAFFDATGRGVANTKWALWAICNGQNGTPNVAGRVVVGLDTSANPALDLNIADNPDLPEAVKAQLNYARPGNTGGGNTKKISVDQMPSHNHTGVTGNNNQSLDHVHDLPNNIQQVDPGAPPSIQGSSDPGAARFSSVGDTATTNNNTTSLVHTHNIPAQGGGQAFDVRQPYIVLTPVMYLGRV